MLRNIVDSFKGIVDVASANINPYTVQVVKLEDYRSLLIQSQDGMLILYKRHGCYECVLTSMCAAHKSYSIFRLSGDGHALAQFRVYSQKLNPIATASSSIYQEDILKKVCDCIQQHQTWTPAHVAAFVGLYECFKQQDFASNLNSTCGKSKSVPLMAAVLGKQLRCVQELLNAGAVMERQDSYGDTVYHYAVNHNLQIIPVLAQYDRAGVINWLNNKGQTALYLACEKSEADAVEALLQAKADPNISACGRYPIHIAVKTENMRSVKLILEKFKDQAHAMDEKNGGIPAHWARSKEMIEMLSRMGSNVNMQSKTGLTPLHVMLDKSRHECILELLCFGADSCISDYDGNTPLHHAVMKDDVEMTRVFVVFGADVDLLNNKGQTARHIASTSKSKNGEKILFILHVSGAKRCDLNAKGCCKGCVTEGTWHGSDDPAMRAVLETDKDAILDEILSSVVNYGEQKIEKTSEDLDRVLCLDGGGIRGLVLVQMLIAIEKHAGKPINECFDWIAGTSTGGLLALGIARDLIQREDGLHDDDDDEYCPIELSTESSTDDDSASEKDLIQKEDMCDEIDDNKHYPTQSSTNNSCSFEKGMSLQYMKGLYFRLKDDTFKGKRPYASEPFEDMLKKEFGETAVMTDIKHPKVIVTGVLADRIPHELHLFRSFHPTMQKTFIEDQKNKKYHFEPVPLPNEQLIWKAARSSGAAPTYFRAAGRFVDGGMAANNPSLDMLTEIQEYNIGLKLRNESHLVHKIGCFVSLGTGRVPLKAVNNPIDVFMPEGIFDIKKSIDGVTGLMNMFVDQATVSEGRPVDRTRAWCSMMDVPFYRLSPKFSENIPLDCTDNDKLINMMWETQCYIVANTSRIQKLVPYL